MFRSGGNKKKYTFWGVTKLSQESKQSWQAVFLPILVTQRRVGCRIKKIMSTSMHCRGDAPGKSPGKLPKSAARKENQGWGPLLNFAD